MPSRPARKSCDDPLMLVAAALQRIRSAAGRATRPLAVAEQRVEDEFRLADRIDVYMAGKHQNRASPK